MDYTIYFPENLANYNFTIAALIGLGIILIFIGIIIGSSRSKKIRKKPE